MMHRAVLVLLLGGVLGVAGKCSPSDCESWCAQPRCSCEPWLWTCKEKCVNDYYSKQCRCTWHTTSLSDDSVFVPDTTGGVLDVEQSTDGSEVVVGRWDGAYVSKGGSAEEFSQVSGTAGKNVWSVAKSGDLVVLGTPDGIYRGVGGAAVERVYAGVPGQGDVVIQGQVVLAATVGGLLASTEGGAAGTWGLVCSAELNATRSAGCQGTARELALSEDGKQVYVVYEGVGAVFAVDLPSLKLSTLVSDASWCNQAHPLTLCSTWSLEVFQGHVVLAPRAQERKLVAYKLGDPQATWKTLAVAEGSPDVEHVLVHDNALYVQQVDTIQRFATVSSAVEVVADRERDSKYCTGSLDALYRPRLGLGVGFHFSPNGKWIVTGSASGVYRSVAP